MIDFRILAQQSTVDALAWTLIHFLWQGALIGFAAFLLLRRRDPGADARRLRQHVCNPREPGAARSPERTGCDHGRGARCENND